MKVLMCEPKYFDINYEINPWMHTDNKVDRTEAKRQWGTLRDRYDELGFKIKTMKPFDGLPDMVFTANGALVINGKVALPKFKYLERQPETTHFKKWFEQNNYKEFMTPNHDFEGEGDALVFGTKILGGWGFRSEKTVHKELEDFFGLEVVSLHLVNDKFYHIDTCLTVLRDDALAFYPEAFDEDSQEKIRNLAPTVLEVSKVDAEAFGLNAVSDGVNVVCSDRATSFHDQLARAGFTVITADISEFQKSGGGVKCLTLTLRD